MLQNSVLQCLTHTPPLAELFLSSRVLTTGGGPTNGFDPLATTRELVQRSLQHRGPIVSPVAHAKSLRRISRRCAAGMPGGEHGAGGCMGRGTWGHPLLHRSLLQVALAKGVMIPNLGELRTRPQSLGGGSA